MKSKFLKVTAATAAAAGLAAAAGSALQRKRIVPKNLVTRAGNAVKLTFPVDKKYDNGVALTPPMGWASWNTFGNRIDENLIYETAVAMKNAGLLEAGYQYVNIDDCWQSSIRDEQGRLQNDFGTFPGGIPALAEKVNALGLKLGIYSSNGKFTCEDLPASLGNEAIDADTFAEWGIEYFKYDFCHNVPIPSRAPCIEKIILNQQGSTEETTLYASQATLTGTARIVRENRLDSGEYIDGLSANAGTAEFCDVPAAQDGDYILTLCIRKRSHANKYVEILVNGSNKYTTILPPTWAVNAAGRHQLKIRLRQGMNTIRIANPVASRQDSTAMQYTEMGKQLKRAVREHAQKTGQAEKPIVYSICEWGMNLPWRWGRKAGNLWRTTPDIKAFWAAILAIYEVNVKLHKYASPGAWNDPDMLEVGNGELTQEENRTHFTLWCMMAAPLILGNDVRKFVTPEGGPNLLDKTLQIVTNKDMIAIDQDALGKQCRRLRTNGLADVLVKPLADGEFALCFFNKGGEERLFTQDLNEVACQSWVDTPCADSYELFDLWEKTTRQLSETLDVTVPAHGVKVYRVKAVME